MKDYNKETSDMEERNRIARLIVNLLNAEKVPYFKVDAILIEAKDIVLTPIKELVEMENQKIVRPVEVD